MEWRVGARLALLIDPDRDTARNVRPWLPKHGLELIQSRTGAAALEILQRMPGHIRLVLVSVSVPDFSAQVLVETLRHFRPELPVICLTLEGQEGIEFDVDGCLPKPLDPQLFDSQVFNLMASGGTPRSVNTIDPAALARARAQYETSGNLLAAAREIANGF